MKKHIFVIVVSMLLLCPVAVVEAKTTKRAHFTYVEFNVTTTGDEMNVIATINKSSVPFKISNRHLLVSYKTKSFFGTYYPASNNVQDSVYYYLEDCGEFVRVVVHFKTNSSGDVKIQFYKTPEKRISAETVTTTFARFCSSVVLGIKKLFVDLVGTTEPDYEKC